MNPLLISIFKESKHHNYGTTLNNSFVSLKKKLLFREVSMIKFKKSELLLKLSSMKFLMAYVRNWNQ